MRRFDNAPVIGYGFHADRLLLGTHPHNAFLHALFQTGILGVIFFVAAVVSAWVMAVTILLRLSRLPAVHKYLVIQAVGVLAFFTLRGVNESSGAFFGVDWLLLAPLLLFLQLMHNRPPAAESPE